MLMANAVDAQVRMTSHTPTKRSNPPDLLSCTLSYTPHYFYLPSGRLNPRQGRARHGSIQQSITPAANYHSR